MIQRHFGRRVLKARSGIRPITAFDTANYPSKLGGMVGNFSPEKFIDPMKIRRMDKVSQLAIVSAIQAIKDSGLLITPENSERAGIVIGTAYGGTATTEEFYVGLLKNGPKRNQSHAFSDYCAKHCCKPDIL